MGLIVANNQAAKLHPTPDHEFTDMELLVFCPSTTAVELSHLLQHGQELEDGEEHEENHMANTKVTKLLPFAEKDTNLILTLS
jgi:hypothetical protein